MAEEKKDKVSAEAESQEDSATESTEEKLEAKKSEEQKVEKNEKETSEAKAEEKETEPVKAGKDVPDKKVTKKEQKTAESRAGNIGGISRGIGVETAKRNTREAVRRLPENDIPTRVVVLAFKTIGQLLTDPNIGSNFAGHPWACIRISCETARQTGLRWRSRKRKPPR